MKAKNTKRDPRVAISVVDFNLYKEVQIRGGWWSGVRSLNLAAERKQRYPYAARRIE